MPRAFRLDQRQAFRDKRLTIEIADAFEYLGRRDAKGRFDLIVADRPDPVGPGKALFGETFYRPREGCAEARRLRHFPDRRAVLPAVGDHRRAEGTRGVFPQSGLYLTVVPTYIGGFMALSWAGKGGTLGTPAGIKRAAARFKAAKLKTDYYNPEIHAAAFAFPEWIKRLVPKTKR